MRTLLCLFGILVSFHSSFASSRIQRDYWSDETVEADVSFSYFVLLNSPARPTPERIRNEIHQQMRMTLYPGENTYAFKDGYETEITSIDLVDAALRLYKASYRFLGRFQISRHASPHFALDLISQPDTVLSKIIVNGENLCGSYTDEADFWAGWNPRRRGCPLQEGVDFVSVTVQANVRANSVETFPEFSRLKDESGQTLIALFFGNDSFQDVTTLASKLSGYSSRQWTQAEIFAISPRDVQDVPMITEFNKTVGTEKMTIRVFTGITGGSAAETKAFRYFFKDAVEHAAFVGYSGHAGLGANLDYESIEKLEGFQIHPRDGYQIYLINACFPYSYFSGSFFDRKKTSDDPAGTKNLDVVASEGYYWAPLGMTLSFVTAIEQWIETRTSTPYQSILERRHGRHSVDGDEDNARP